MKVDLISFPTSPKAPESDSVCNRGDGHKLVPFCSPNPAIANPSPFRSSPWFLIKTRVHAFPRSKQDGQELKRQLTWWLILRARARVRGPAIGTGVGADASSVLMSSSMIIDSSYITQWGLTDLFSWICWNRLFSRSPFISVLIAILMTILMKNII